MNYRIVKDIYKPSKKYIWKNGSCLGFIHTEIKEKHDISWKKYKEDKTLKMTVSDRLSTNYNAISYPNIFCGQYSSLEEAILAIRDKQQNMFDNLENFDIITIGDSDV
jgi:hypothetical protein